MKKIILFTSILLLLLGCKVYGKDIDQQIYSAAVKYCNQYNVDIYLFYAIYESEGSIKDPTCMSSVNYDGSVDIGIMQINSNNTEVMQRCGVTDLYNVEQNIKCAVYLMSVNSKWLEKKEIPTTVFNLAAMYNSPKSFFNYFEGKYTEECPTAKYALKTYNTYIDYCEGTKLLLND